MSETSQSSYVQGFVNGRHEIVNFGYDPVLSGNLLPMTHDGIYAARLGEYNLGSGSSTSLKYSFVVTPNNSNFSFNYAMVMGDPLSGHKPYEKPYFSYTILTLNPNYELIRKRKFTSDVNNPFFNVAQNNIVWKNWSTECIDLSDYIGKEVVVIFEVASCSLGANSHFSYAYLDGLCTDNSAVPRFHMKKNLCADKTIKLYGGGSKNEDSYFIGIQKSDVNWQGIGTEFSKWFVAQEVGTIDLTQLLLSLGGVFECNSYYRIKLAVSNNCTPWVEKTKLIYVRCPEVPNLENKGYCCQLFNDYVDLGFEGQSFPNYNFQWTAISPDPNFFQINGNGETITTVPYLNGTGVQTSNSTFNVEITDEYGCKSNQDITLRMINGLDSVYIEEQVDENDCCSKKYKVNLAFNGNCAEPLTDDEIDEYFDFVWSNGDTGRTITLDYSYNYNLSVTVSNYCGNDKVAQITHTPVTSSTVVYDASSIIASNAMDITSNNPLRNRLVISSYGPNVPLNGNLTDDAYGINGYRLTIFNRWGSIIRIVEDDSKCWYYQNEIGWDGKDASGHFVQQGVYNYIFEVKLCGNWVEVCEMGASPVCIEECWRWTWFPPFREKYCCNYQEQGVLNSYANGVSQCRYYVTVIN